MTSYLGPTMYIEEDDDTLDALDADLLREYQFFKRQNLRYITPNVRVPAALRSVPPPPMPPNHTHSDDTLAMSASPPRPLSGRPRRTVEMGPGRPRPHIAWDYEYNPSDDSIRPNSAQPSPAKITAGPATASMTSSASSSSSVAHPPQPVIASSKPLVADAKPASIITAGSTPSQYQPPKPPQAFPVQYQPSPPPAAAPLQLQSSTGPAPAQQHTVPQPPVQPKPTEAKKTEPASMAAASAKPPAPTPSSQPVVERKESLRGLAHLERKPSLSSGSATFDRKGSLGVVVKRYDPVTSTQRFLQTKELSAQDKAYLEKHGVEALINNALATLLANKPENAQELLAQIVFPRYIEIATSLAVYKDELSKKTLHIVHFNDVYHIQPVGELEPIGGAARFSTVLERLVAEKNPLILFSGDFMGPSKESSLTRGRHMVECLNYLNVKYGVFGNHEFDYGYDKLSNFVNCTTSGKEEQFTGFESTWIMSNMRVKETKKPLADAEPYAIILWSGVKVGLLGLCEDWLSSCPRLEAGKFEYLDIFETGQKMALELKQQGCEIVIALTHNRLDMDIQVTEKCPAIDLLLGGHDHFYKNALAEHRVIKSGQEFQWLTEVKIVIRGQSKPKISCVTHDITKDIPEDPEMGKLVAAYDRYMQKKMGKVVMVSKVPIDSTEECLRFKESLLGNWLADRMKEHAKAECAVICGASIAGDITLGSFCDWFPTEVSCCSEKLPGSQLLLLLQICAKQLPGECGGFPHSAGLQFAIDATKPWNEDRIHSVLVNGAPLNKNQEYSIAVTDFIAARKGPFKKLSPVKPIIEEEFAVQMVDLLRNWCTDQFKAQGKTPEFQSALGRINLTMPAKA